MKTIEIGLVVATALALALPPGAAVAAPGRGVVPYDGTLPFNCKLQQVGTGTKFPDPQADPFCVEYDKTNQNLSQLGIVDFAMQEPARAAVSWNKCFYFQHDHWTGWVVQGGKPELWHWDGSYYWDKARGAGAMYFENLRVGGYGDWSPIEAPLPADVRPFTHPTGWGAVLYTSYPVDQRCAAMVDTPEKAARVYGEPADAPPRGAVAGERCSHRRRRHQRGHRRRRAGASCRGAAPGGR